MCICCLMPPIPRFLQTGGQACMRTMLSSSGLSHSASFPCWNRATQQACTDPSSQQKPNTWRCTATPSPRPQNNHWSPYVQASAAIIVSTGSLPRGAKPSLGNIKTALLQSPVHGTGGTYTVTTWCSHTQLCLQDRKLSCFGICMAPACCSETGGVTNHAHT